MRNGHDSISWTSIFLTPAGKALEEHTFLCGQKRKKRLMFVRDCDGRRRSIPLDKSRASMEGEEKAGMEREGEN